MQQQLEFERTARHDLEMHTRTLVQQKILLQSESDSLEKTVNECMYSVSVCVSSYCISIITVNEKLKVQEENYKQLQQTWEMANQHFIVAQDKLKQKMYFMEQKQQLLLHDSNHSSEL